MPIQLPNLILLQSYGGDFNRYIDAVYDEFRRDFLGAPFNFNGKRVGLKRYPIENGKEATFWHMVSTGRVEADRKIDIRRCERIAWPRVILDNASDPCLKVWNEEAHGEFRTHIFYEAEEYLVVISDRGQYVLPWTAFDVHRRHQKDKLLRRWERYA